MFCQSRNVRQVLRELLDKYENLKQKKKRYKYKAEDEDDKSEDEDKVIANKNRICLFLSRSYGFT